MIAVSPAWRWRLKYLEAPPSEGGWLAPVEGIRAAAIVLVFFVHYHTLFGDYVASSDIGFAISRTLGTIGHAGVDLFFALSGFLIYAAVLRGRHTYLQFIGRRLRRIYPTFAAVFAMYVILSFVFRDESKIPPAPADALRYLAANAMLLAGVLPIRPMITVSWSLSFELAFYLVVPFAVAVLRLRSWSSWARAALLALAIAAWVVVFVARPATYLRMAMFLGGMLAYELVSLPRMRERLSRVPDLVVVALLLGAAFSQYSIPGLGVHAAGAHYLSGITISAALVMGCTLLVSQAVIVDAQLRRLFSGPVIRSIGHTSYSFFLLHGLILKGLSRLAHSVAPPAVVHWAAYWGMMPVIYAIAFCGAVLLFLAVERPFLVSKARRPAPVQPYDLGPGRQVEIAG
jgi:exopolysaccharide production protein ExoZ